jgi:hypothetical protein
MAPSTFWSPWLWCSIPRACSRKLVLAFPHISPALRTAFSVMPVTSAVRLGVHSCTCSASASNPDVCFAMKSYQPVVLNHEIEDSVE